VASETSSAPAAGEDRAAIVGLGNPGPRYDGTRHNLGFRVIDVLHARRGADEWRELCAALWARSETMDLVKPQTYMNRSGHAVRCLVERLGYRPERVLVVYDDIALPLGTLRLRPGGGPGGHRGLASILAGLRTEAVPRLRLGISPIGETPAGDLAEFVLHPFEAAERSQVERQVERAADACEAWLERGLAAAMNAFNGPTPAPEGARHEGARAEEAEAEGDR
jgi:PTH1 family peptidyl-tRNA hydrolase